MISLHEKSLAKATFDFLEVLGHINLLNKFDVFEPNGNADDTLQWQAFSTAALISYARPFLRSNGLPRYKKELEEQLSSDCLKLRHEKFIRKRNKLIAHSDSDGFEIQIRNTNKTAMSMHSEDKYLSKAETEELRLLTSEMLTISIDLRTKLNNI
jgi:hypothetical protein